MSTNTTNYNLVKPALTDAADITATNGNWDTIDTQLKLNEKSRLLADTTVYVATTGNDTTGTGANNAPYKTIQKAINSMPKNLNGYILTINISSGTYPEVVNILNFSNGQIVLVGNVASDISITQLKIVDASVELRFAYFTFTSTSIAIEVGYKGVLTSATQITINAANKGVSVVDNGLISINEIGISNTNVAIECGYCGKFFVATLYGTSNNVGFEVSAGGQISYMDNRLSATVLGSTYSGGRIYSGSQTNIPNY